MIDDALQNLPLAQQVPRQPAQSVVPAMRDAAGLATLRARLQNVFGDRFEVLQPAALGGMATIFQVRHRLHKGLFAAKVLHAELGDRSDVVESFRTEAIHAAQLADHPNTVPVFDFGELDGLFFLIMPWIEGEDLDQILRRHGPLERSDALLLAAQVSSVLCHAEAHGIVHGDLTPGNLRLDLFGNYRVLDFGLSRAGNSERPRSSLGGTPLYLSPEQAAGFSADHRGDLYSLGVILFEVLMGRPLYPASSLEELAEMRTRGVWHLSPALQADEGLRRLLERLLAPKPENRMQSAFELSGALEAFGFKRPEFRDSLRPAAPAPSPDATPRRRRLSAE